MGMIKKKRCRNCRRLFIPDHRNRDRQKYCKTAICRKASKSASQEKWLNKPENNNYFRGALNVQRVQEWRRQNPGYWKPKDSNKAIALQEPLTPQTSENNKDNSDFTNNALQDLLTQVRQNYGQKVQKSRCCGYNLLILLIPIARISNVVPENIF